MIRTVTVLVLLVLVLAVAPVQADTITFNDLTGSLSMTVVGSRAILQTAGCSTVFEFCQITLVAPAGTNSFLEFGGGDDLRNPPSVFPPGGERIAEADVSLVGLALVSDTLGVLVFANSNTHLPGFVEATFISGIDGGTLPPVCFVPQGFCFSENGQVQLGATIVWCSSAAAQDCIPPTSTSPGLNVLAVDTFQFCSSDVESTSSTCLTGGGNSVPEPDTLLLFAAGLVGLAGIRWSWHRGKNR